MGDVRTKLELQDNFSAKMREIVASMNAAVEMAENFRKSMGTDINAHGLKNYQNELDKTNRVIRQTEQAAYGYAKAENEVSDKSDKAAQSVRKQADAYGDIEPAAKRASAGISGTADSLNNLFLAAGGYKVLQFVKSAFTDTASAAIEFESAITGVYKTVDGTQEQLLGLSDAARNMALNIPSDVTEIARVMESAGQLGIATDSIESFTETMIALGESTNLSADEAASSLAKFANVTGMSADNYSNLGSVIVDLGNNFATTEADIVDMSSYLASAASLAGLAETDILALATAMTSVGINAEAGGSSMSRLITAMQTAVETGSANLEQFASVADMTAQEFSAAFGENAIGAIEAFIAGLNDVERNGASASVILQQMDLDDIRLANTIKALASSSGVLSSAVTTANTAWTENTALTTEAEKRYKTLESKLQLTKNAANELEIAVGGALSPTIGGLADMTTEALKGLAGLADSCPVLTTGIMGTVGAVGTVTGAFSTLAPSITAVSSAMQAMNKTLSLGRIGLVVGGIALLGGVIGAIAGAANNAKDEVEDYNGTLAQCSEEISTLEGQYKAVVDAYGANSEAAKSLESQLEKLNAQYEKGGGAAADYAERINENSKQLSDMAKAYNDTVNDINNTSNSELVMIAQLQALSDKTVKTSADLEMMGNYADHLNNTFNCDIVVNYDTGDLTGFNPKSMAQQAYDNANEKLKAAAIDQITDVEKIKQYGNAINDLSKAEKTRNELAIKLRALNNSGFVNYDNTDYGKMLTDYQNLSRDIEGYNKKIYDYENLVRGELSAFGSESEADAYISNMRRMYDENWKIPKINSPWDFEKFNEQYGVLSDFSGATEDVSESVTFMSAKSQKAYEEMYEACAKSFDGQFGLFDKASKDSESTVNSLIDAQKSQIEYWSSYADNVKYLSKFSADELGMSEIAFANFTNLIASGSPEAAGLVSDMREQIEKNGVGSVKSIGSNMTEIYRLQDEATKSTAEWGAGIGEEAQLAVKAALDAVNGGIDGFAEAGIKAMDNFAAGIKSGINSAINAAQTVARSIENVFNNINIKIPGISYPTPKGTTVNGPGDLIGGYATGTLSAAPGLALVGENGPELVNFGGGEVVYTAQETQRILSQQQQAAEVYIPENLKQAIEYGERFQNDNISMPHEAAASGTTRRVVVEIAGNGSVEVTGGANKEELLGLLMESVEPAIMDILLTEIYEEGDDSYEY